MPPVGNKSPFRIGRGDFPANHPLSRAELDQRLRASIVHWALWCIANKHLFDYTEGPKRLSMYRLTPGETNERIEADCSASVSGLYKWGGAPDPNKLSYGGDPFTGTLLKGMSHVQIGAVRPGDVIVYGGGTGEHAVLVLERLSPTDFMVFSHGQQGDPSRIRHSDLEAWMRRHGHPGVSFLSSLP